jgi:predicted nuclease of predicted toxin-antitoxin system
LDHRQRTYSVAVIDLGLERATDNAIWDRATTTKGAIITKDEDFANRKALHADGPPIVWIRFGNASRSELLARIEAHWPAALEALARGDGVIELS